MKKILIISILVCFTLQVMAVPAHPGKRQQVNPDGTVTEYFVHGDEVYHYYTDTEGNILTRDTESRLVRSSESITEDIIRSRRLASPIKHRAAIRRANAANLISKGLVILVQFSDTVFKASNDKTAFDNLLNGDTYTYNGATGSVRKYFQDQSSGVFTPTFDIYGPVTLSGAKADYGSNDSRGYDKGVGKMVKEACELAYSEYSIDFSQYDADGDGEVDFIDVLYAGYGEADSDDEDSVWPCEWSLSASDAGSALTLGGKTIDTFSCHQELDGYGSMKGKRAGIATACHEFGHVFGLPDFYDTTYKNPTLGDWDIMDGGSYNNNGRTPPSYSGYERLFTGWAEARVINQPESITLQELQSSQQVLIITETGVHNLSGTNPNPKTFYILENRQQKGWDRYVPGHGMLIWRIQYNAYEWYANTVNNHAVAQQGVSIMAADGEVYNRTINGIVYSYGDSGDTYPGTSIVTEYAPYAQYNITDIAESNGVISFNFMTHANLTYTLKGVVLVEGSTAAGTIDKNTAINARFVAQSGYYALSKDNCIINVSVDGESITSSSDFQEDTLTVSLPAEQVTGKVVISITAQRNPAGSTCEDYFYTYTGVPVTGTEVFLDDILWNITLEGSENLGFNTSKGAQFGNANNPPSLLHFVTSDFSTCTTKSIIVTACRAILGNDTLVVKIGNQQIGDSVVLNSTVTDYTFPNTENLTGDISISFCNSDKHIFVKSLQVRFSDTPAEEAAIADGLCITSSNGQMNLNNINQTTQVDIYNTVGQCIARQTISSDTQYHLPSGIYIVCTEAQNMRQTFKVIIRE